MHRLLVVHLVTESVLPQFKGAQLVQRIFSRGYEGIDRIAISDCDVPGIRTILTGAMFIDGYYNLSRHRNLAIDYADQHGYTHVMALDCDYVCMQAPTILPDYWCAPLSVWDQHDAITFDTPNLGALLAPYAVKPNAQLAPKHDRLRCCSCLILNRSVFTKMRYNEDFWVYYYEDTEFGRRLLHSRLKHGYSDMLLLHLYHDKREDKPWILQHNKRLDHRLRRH